MAQRGSFKRMLEKMIELMGREDAERVVMFSSNAGSDYILTTPEDAGTLKRLDVDSDLRTVLAPTYRELRHLLQQRQTDFFRKVADGNSPKGI